jgi:AcrR family transcriptional regulator
MVYEPVGGALSQVSTGCVNLRPGYRVRQFWLALNYKSKPVEEVVLRTHLNTAQITLFRRMSAAEQTHALAVLRTLGREQVMGGEPALAQAALLHDVGKVEGRIRLWHRVAAVLLQALRPALLNRLALNEPHSWRYPFFVLLHHAEHGADLSAGAGTDAVAVALIRAHHTAPEQSGLDAPSQAVLTALRWADGQN